MTHEPTGDIFTRRVCLQLDGMDAVVVRRDIAYGPTDRGVRLDAYYPPDEGNDGRWPAVIIVAGYPGTTGPRPTTLAYKEIGWTVSMCQLIAASGMVAVAYRTVSPSRISRPSWSTFTNALDRCGSIRPVSGSWQSRETCRPPSRASCSTRGEGRRARCSAMDAFSISMERRRWQMRRGSSASQTHASGARSPIFDGMYRC